MLGRRHERPDPAARRGRHDRPGIDERRPAALRSNGLARALRPRAGRLAVVRPRPVVAERDVRERRRGSGESVPLRRGDEIRVGTVRFVAHLDGRRHPRDETVGAETGPVAHPTRARGARRALQPDVLGRRLPRAGVDAADRERAGGHRGRRQAAPLAAVRQVRDLSSRRAAAPASPTRRSGEGRSAPAEILGRKPPPDSGMTARSRTPGRSSRMMESVDPDRIVGTDVAGYAVESVLGRGAMGVVYVARQRFARAAGGPEADHAGLRRRRGLPAAVPPRGDGRRRDRAPAHPSRLRRGRGRTASCSWRCGWSTAQDLREILRGSAGLPLDRVVEIVGQIGRGARRRARRGLVHRDVKPGNILVIRAAPTGGGRLLLPDRLRRQHLDRVVGRDDHDDGSDGRDGELRGTRADRGDARRREHRPVLVGVRAVRVPYRPGAVQRSEPGRDPVRPPPRAAAAPELDPAGLAGRAWTPSSSRALRKIPEERYASVPGDDAGPQRGDGRFGRHAPRRCRLAAATGGAHASGRRPGGRDRSWWLPWPRWRSLVAVVGVTRQRSPFGIAGPRAAPSVIRRRATQLIREGVQVTASSTAPSRPTRPGTRSPTCRRT